MDPIQALLLQNNRKTTYFPSNSRYHNTETAVLETPNEAPISYLKRRFVPSADAFATLQEHRVEKGQRLDNITHQYLGDPELFWKLCDANNAMHPLELTETTNRIIRITMPHGIPIK